MGHSYSSVAFFQAVCFVCLLTTLSNHYFRFCQREMKTQCSRSQKKLLKVPCLSKSLPDKSKITQRKSISSRWIWNWIKLATICSETDCETPCLLMMRSPLSLQLVAQTKAAVVGSLFVDWDKCKEDNRLISLWVARPSPRWQDPIRSKNSVWGYIESLCQIKKIIVNFQSIGRRRSEIKRFTNALTCWPIKRRKFRILKITRRRNSSEEDPSFRSDLKLKRTSMFPQWRRNWV